LRNRIRVWRGLLRLPPGGIRCLCGALITEECRDPRRKTYQCPNPECYERSEDVNRPTLTRVYHAYDGPPIVLTRLP
jgi:hypothetical protein